MNHVKFKAVCVEKGISNKELAVLWKCRSLQTVTNKRSGRTGITLDEAKAFSDYAKLTPQERLDIFLT